MKFPAVIFAYSKKDPDQGVNEAQAKCFLFRGSTGTALMTTTTLTPIGATPFRSISITTTLEARIACAVPCRLERRAAAVPPCGFACFARCAFEPMMI